jgi:PAS domain S-box-containing protein
MGSTRKRSTARAREAEPPTVAVDELAAAFDHAPVGMAITDERATLLRVNAAMARILGYTAKELIGKSVVDLTYPDDLTDSVASNERIARGEIASFTLEKRYLHKSGRAVWARVFVSTLKGDPRRHLLHVVDISEEKQSSARLLDTETRFREMADAIDQDFWIINLTPFELLYSSPAAKRIWGFDPMINRDHPDRILQFIHPDDLDAYSKLLDPEHPVPGEVEYRIIRPDGALRWVRTHAFPIFDAAGRFYRVTGMTEDITPRKEAELEVENHRAFERFIMNLCTAFVNLPADSARKTFEVALGELATMIGADSAAIFVIDDKTHVLAAKYSWVHDTASPGPTYADFSFAPDNPFRARILNEGFLRVDDVEALPAELDSVRQRLIDYDVRSFIDLPLVRRGKLVGLYGFGTIGRKAAWPRNIAARLAIAAEVFSNAIERAQMEAEVRRHRDALAHALRVGTMGQLASGIAHELNQPLAAILNYASASERRVAAGNTDIEQIRDAVRRIAEQAMRAADVIKTLRALVRKGEGERTWHDARELVRTAVGFVEPELIAPGIEIVQEHATDLQNVQVDPIQIEQVILNLVRNAIDAVRADSDRRRRKRLQIRVTTRLQAPSTVVVSVSDNGPGVDPDHVEFLFDEFYTTKDHGLGLGLSISRSIVESHGGALWLESTSPSGTTFCFSLPAAEQ